MQIGRGHGQTDADRTAVGQRRPHVFTVVLGQRVPQPGYAQIEANFVCLAHSRQVGPVGRIVAARQPFNLIGSHEIVANATAR